MAYWFTIYGINFDVFNNNRLEKLIYLNRLV